MTSNTPETKTPAGSRPASSSAAKAPAKTPAKSSRKAPAKAQTKAPAKPAAKAPAKKAEPKAKAYTIPTGYALKYPHGGYDLLRKVNKDTEGPAWLVTCNAHGDTTGVKTAKEGDQKGKRAEMALWCKGHKAEAKKAAKASEAKAS